VKVYFPVKRTCSVDLTVEIVEEPDEDNMEEIDTANVIGSRTRGKNIDFAKANQELGDEDEEDDDEDFVDPDDEMKD
jgi:hypothetical protein